MNRISKTLGIGWSLLTTLTLAADTAKPIIMDHTSAALRNVASRFWAAEYSPDGSLLASSDGKGEVRFWNPDSGENLGTLKAHSNLCFGLDFSPNGPYLVTASWDRQIIIWNVKTRQKAATLLRAEH